MTVITYLYPGQGSQRAGMGADLVDAHPEVLDLFYRPADELLGFELSTLCHSGSLDDLQRTEITQPAILLTSVVTTYVLGQRGLEASMTAGHSLGEYSALVAAGVLDWQDALRLVRRRGCLMAAANERIEGAMAAIIGLSVDTVEEFCALARARTDAVVSIANYNQPEQQVLSGARRAVDDAATRARDAGAERVVMLPVGAPFHCELMRSVAEEYATDLDTTTFTDPQIPVYSGSTGQVIRTGAEARAALHEQLAAPVRWIAAVDALANAGSDAFVEVGPGKVLGGFCRALRPDIPWYPTANLRAVQRTVAGLGL